MYISEDWLVNPDNMEKIHRLISELFFSDIIIIGLDDNNEAIFEEKLLEMGETILVEKLRAGELILRQA
ncbi:MAG: hypothetical protein ACOX3P_00860 [Saccharofermentanales bacterium]|jgi:hypothetical protein|nr:hypothetical protein [Bacillota bacterium]NLB08201.1 hypothetical protein [Clostridiales bacterium]